MVGLPIRSLFAGIELIELRRLKANHSALTTMAFNISGAPMNRRSLFLAIAAAVIIVGVGTRDARAGNVPLPATLDNFVGANSGNFTTVAAPNEVDTFSQFTYSPSVLLGNPPPVPVLAADQVTLKEFHAGPEAGITFSGAFFAPANTIVDYAITYTVTAPAGHFLTDASLSGAFSTFGGTGSGSVSELLLFPNGTSKSMEISSSGGASDSAMFPGVQSIQVSKDILLVGGSAGASISIINQGFSSTGVPEPASFALLGIGMTGFLALRRFFKKTSVA
jgi:PEP-CTERM motif